MRRYLQNTKWITNPTTEAQLQAFNETVSFFKKYAFQYDLDYLLLVAQGYQECMLNQPARHGSGVVIMQAKPAIAAAPLISIPDVMAAPNNIHAGVKVLHTISDTYFNNPQIDPMNRLLFTFAAYNAGPTRIAALRKKVAAQGLDPNQVVRER